MILCSGLEGKKNQLSSGERYWTQIALTLEKPEDQVADSIEHVLHNYPTHEARECIFVCQYLPEIS